MIVEHTFVTTLEEPEAMSAAADMLKSAGFFDEASPAPRSRQWGHGIEQPRTAAQARKTIRLSYDRGRVVFAASARFARPDHSKLYEPVLVALANATESVIVTGAPPADALAPVQQAIGGVYGYDKRRTITKWIIVGLILLPIVGGFVAGFVSAFLRHH